jgi:hypothetical protein
MSIKQWLYDQVKIKAKRRERLSEEISQRGQNIEAHILRLLEELDGVMSSIANMDILDVPRLKAYYIGSVHERVRLLDPGAQVQVIWSSKVAATDIPRVDGVLVRWSEEYQAEMGCEPELFVDMSALLFKE